MGTESNISPALEPFLAHSAPEHKFEAIVLYRLAENKRLESLPPRGRTARIEAEARLCQGAGHRAETGAAAAAGTLSEGR